MGTNIGGAADASAVIGVIRNGEHMGVVEAEPAPIRLAIELHSPVEGHFEAHVLENMKTPNILSLTEGIFAGQKLALCGAGPSLKGEKILGVDQIFACNSAVNYLMGEGVNVTAAVGIDQTPGLLREWMETFDIPYYVASTCDPELIRHLTAHQRQLLFFHNHVGIVNELDFYNAHWPADSYMVGQGFTVVSRFIGMAKWLGFERIDVYGADCALGEGDIAHANGEHVEDAYHNPLLMTGKLPPSPREWRTRPDMLRDAVQLARTARDSRGQVRLIGDTLPVALLGKDDAYLDMVSRTLAPGEAPPVLP